MYLSRIVHVIALSAALGLVATVVACGDDDGEDRPGVDVIGSGSGSVSGSGTASGTGAGIEPGVVDVKPGDAAQVNVKLQEWSIVTEQDSVEAGKIYFLVENVGPDDPHEFVIIRTDTAPGDLPTADGRVPEDEIDLIDEIEPYAPGTTASITVTLEPGSYVFICNIAEIEDGELESHYELGMYTAFTVE